MTTHTNKFSSAEHTPLPHVEAQPERPATEAPSPARLVTSVAGHPPTTDDDVAREQQTSDRSGAPSLPQGTMIRYAAALRRAQRKASLAKYAQLFWDERGGWQKWSNTPDGEAAAAIFRAFRDNFGNRDAIERELREII